MSSTKECFDQLGQWNDYVQQIVDSLEDEFFAIDSNFRVTRVNRAFSLHWGHAIGKTCYEVFMGDSGSCPVSRLNCPVLAVLQNGSHIRESQADCLTVAKNKAGQKQSKVRLSPASGSVPVTLKLMVSGLHKYRLESGADTVGELFTVVT